MAKQATRWMGGEGKSATVLLICMVGCMIGMTVGHGPVLPPECQQHLHQRRGKPVLSLNDGKYVRSDAPPRYDHATCWLMKARYNCAYPDQADDGTRAHNWKFVLQAENQTTPCDFAAIVEREGGPAGIARHFRVRRRRKVPPSRPVNVLMLGNSIMRQVFEAISCGWKDQVITSKAMGGGPDISLRGLNKHPAKFQDFEVGEVFNVPTSKGCHGTTGPPSAYYREGVVPPEDNWSGHCNDNAAMVEFEGIRFHYIFRANIYADPVGGVLRKLDLNATDVDMIYWNAGDPPHNIFPKGSFPTDVMQEAQLFDQKAYMVGVQYESLGMWFGADNPFTRKTREVADNTHPCMPGPPDDAANLLLLGLFADFTIHHTRLVTGNDKHNHSTSYHYEALRNQYAHQKGS